MFGRLVTDDRLESPLTGAHGALFIWTLYLHAGTHVVSRGAYDAGDQVDDFHYVGTDIWGGDLVYD